MSIFIIHMIRQERCFFYDSTIPNQGREKFHRCIQLVQVSKISEKLMNLVLMQMLWQNSFTETVILETKQVS